MDNAQMIRFKWILRSNHARSPPVRNRHIRSSHRTDCCITDASPRESEINNGCDSIRFSDRRFGLLSREFEFALHFSPIPLVLSLLTNLHLLDLYMLLCFCLYSFIWLLAVFSNSPIVKFENAKR
ncbi:unnamed protein product [Prunus brigantina]